MNAKPERIDTSDTVALVESLRSTECPACGGSKFRRQSFCRTCYRSLPANIRANLYLLVGDGYEEAFDAAMDHVERRRTP